MQEYQFQQETGDKLSREDIMDTVRRSIQRAAALTASDLKKGVSALATVAYAWGAEVTGCDRAPSEYS